MLAAYKRFSVVRIQDSGLKLPVLSDVPVQDAIILF